MNCGDTFMLEDANETKEHLHVIITPPDSNQEVVTVAICTRQRWSEKIVCLEVGAHPFIKHSSVASYRHATIRPLAKIEQAINARLARIKEPVTPALLKRLQQGLIDSDFVSNEVRAYFITHIPL